MIEIATAVAIVLPVYLVTLLFGYWVALGHVDRLLDIEEGEATPELLPGLHESGGRALSAEDIDQMDDWDRWK
ncbi:hypothetical protein AArcSl_3214 [Halalkaliarchaeum desulfuricum]|uniref:Uncharacterized protein n=1 Tax=Halalkaliarchaeum desulfuricum TaxID=2055893 RepID=A0A343TNZ8_9EURY|nr:hypothetical protein [Halalkaliarchaeum desulfuricum]AUX10820.1 hypothetical protein AArcSl_3214 [Halalkaliarchaeum desulfuricum]